MLQEPDPDRRGRTARLRGLLRRGGIRDEEPRAFVRFCLVGASGMIVDLACFRLLLGASVPHAAARAVAIAIAMTWNFAWNRRFTFVGAREGSLLKQYARYALSMGLGALLSWSAAVALAQVLPREPRWLLLGAVVGIGLGTGTNFLLASRWAFFVGPRRARASARRRGPRV